MSQFPKKKYTFKNFVFWAQGGMIALLDTENMDHSIPDINSVKWIRPAEFIRRALGAIALMRDKYPDQRKIADKLREDALACIREAKEQGDITNPTILNKKVEEYKPVKLFIPGEPQRTGVQKLYDDIGNLVTKSDATPEKVLEHGF